MRVKHYLTPYHHDLRCALQITLVVLALVVDVIGMFDVNNPLYASIELPREPLLDTKPAHYSE